MLQINYLNNTIDDWIAALQQYTFEQLCTVPVAGSWSLGQLYIHLINDTKFYIEQATIALTKMNMHTKALQLLQSICFDKMLFPKKRSPAILRMQLFLNR